MSDALIAMVHEMRNALVPVLTDLRAIRAAGVGHDRMERLDRIEAAVMRALNYIDQVMRASNALRPAQRDETRAVFAQELEASFDEEDGGQLIDAAEALADLKAHRENS